MTGTLENERSTQDTEQQIRTMYIVQAKLVQLWLTKCTCVSVDLVWGRV